MSVSVTSVGRAETIPSSIPSANLRLEGSGNQQGTLLSSHWLVADGSVVNSVPDETVTWPPPLTIPDQTMPLEMRLNTGSLPARVELRRFDGGVDASGIPVGLGELISCLPNGPTSEGCVALVKGAQIAVLVRSPAYKPVMHLVVYSEWYLPMAQRPALSRSNPVLSASWGFSLRMN